MGPASPVVCAVTPAAGKHPQLVCKTRDAAAPKRIYECPSGSFSFAGEAPVGVCVATEIAVEADECVGSCSRR